LVARPFRFQPPSLPRGAVQRPRLVALLAGRWDHRLVTVTAGPGFGKTVVLLAAMTDTARPTDARDVWLTCEPADADADHLAAGLCEAFGLSSKSSVESMFDAVWAAAPRAICFVLDDVHEISAGSTGASLLGRLIGALPGNAHLVLASRDAAPTALARLAASDQLVRVGEEQMVFDHAELASFAFARGVEPAVLEPTGGWPALAELAAAAGTADLVPDYLWEEVLARIGDDRANLLARLSVVGGGGDDIASALAGRPTRVDELVANVPLVARNLVGAAARHSDG